MTNYVEISGACAILTARLHFFLGKLNNMKKKEKKIIVAGNTRARLDVLSVALGAPPVGGGW